MGDQFRPVTAAPERGLREYVPRAPDQNGGGNQGHSLVGLVYGEEVLFAALAIRDTDTYQSDGPAALNPTGVPFDQVYALSKTALVSSTLDQAVSLQQVFSRDAGETWLPFGDPTSLDAYSGSGDPVCAVIALSTPQLYVPYVGLQATCADAPASGVLNGWLERLG